MSLMENVIAGYPVWQWMVTLLAGSAACGIIGLVFASVANRRAQERIAAERRREAGIACQYEDDL